MYSTCAWQSKLLQGEGKRILLTNLSLTDIFHVFVLLYIVVSFSFVFNHLGACIS